MGSIRKPPAEVKTLDSETFKLALYSIDTILRYRAYTSGELLVMLLGRFRDDAREAHGKDPLLPAQRGAEHLPLRELELSELDMVVDSAGTLIDQFGPFMDDPELSALLAAFRDALNLERHERTKPREESEQHAKAS
jgi:hypothetical protein